MRRPETSDNAISSGVTPEFALIAKHFDRPAKKALLGVGDDCALWLPTAGQTLAISTDTLVSGVHFFANVDAAKLGHKALAVNLSDLAAMGATPCVFTLALSLPLALPPTLPPTLPPPLPPPPPRVDDAWLAGFAAGLFRLAAQHDIELIGGDTTRGPLAISITVIGEVDPRTALRRDRARAGDDIWVSGDLGGASLALRRMGADGSNAGVSVALLEKLELPQPRIALGTALRGIAHAAIDISDGLVADLGHIASRSGLKATVFWKDIPRHPALDDEALSVQQACALAGGDDYELCFSAPASSRAAMLDIAQSLGLRLSRIGSFSPGAASVEVIDATGERLQLPTLGFDHFSAQRVTTNEA